MSDTLEIFGKEWTGVTGIKATDDNDTIKTYIRPQGNKAITMNGQNIDVAAYETVSVAVTDSTLVVTVSWNSTTSKWTPNKTWAEIYAAYDAGKTITVEADGTPQLVSADGLYYEDGGYNDDWLTIEVREITSTNPWVMVDYEYIYNANGLDLNHSKTYRQPPTGTITISSAGNTDVTNYATASVPTASFYTGEEHGFYTESNVRKWRYRGMTDLDVSEGDTEGWHGTGRQYGDYKVHTAVPSNTTITPTTSAQTVGGANYMMEGAVTVNAMPTGTVTAPASISGSSATVSTGTNTLTLSKTVSVTPSVTTAGYVSSGTAGNSSVSLTANVTTKGAATITPTTTDQTIASGTYLTGTQTISGDANLVAGNIKSGTTIFGVTGTYSGGGTTGKACYVYMGLASRQANSYGATSASVTVAKAGTYTISYVAVRGSSSGTMGTNLHIGATSGTNNTTWNNGTYGQAVKLTGQTISANTTVTIYATSGSNSRYIYVGNLIVQEE